jgi:hypothetical protein
MRIHGTWDVAVQGHPTMQLADIGVPYTFTRPLPPSAVKLAVVTDTA